MSNDIYFILKIQQKFKNFNKILKEILN